MSQPAPEPTPLVANDFVVPRGLNTAHFVLEPLQGSHNEADFAAWTSSIDHIRSSPGFGPHRDWPEEGMPLSRNLRDLEKHYEDFEQRTGFTFTVLDPDDVDRVIGCIYIYPDPTGDYEVEVRSWVTASVAHLDSALRATVATWLRSDWPFRSVRYEGVPGTSDNEEPGPSPAE